MRNQAHQCSSIPLFVVGTEHFAKGSHTTWVHDWYLLWAQECQVLVASQICLLFRDPKTAKVWSALRFFIHRKSRTIHPRHRTEPLDRMYVTSTVVWHNWEEPTMGEVGGRIVLVPWNNFEQWQDKYHLVIPTPRKLHKVSWCVCIHDKNSLIHRRLFNFVQRARSSAISSTAVGHLFFNNQPSG